MLMFLLVVFQVFVLVYTLIEIKPTDNVSFVFVLLSVAIGIIAIIYGITRIIIDAKSASESQK